MTDIVRDRYGPTDIIADRDRPSDPFMDFLSYCIDALENEPSDPLPGPADARLRPTVKKH